MERRRLATCQFKDRIWKMEEPLEVYAGELERLIDKAFPDLAAPIREQQLIDRFIEGMPDFVRYELELHAEDTFAATITRARELKLLQERLKSSTAVKSSVNLMKGVVQAPVLNSVKPRDPCVVGLERRLEQLEQLS